MAIPRAAQTQRRTRIQEEKEELILEAALEVFSQRGFHGSTIDQIAEVAGMSKPNLLYYFRTKEAMHRALIDRVLENWLEPLQTFDAEGDPEQEIRAYIRRKLDMAQAYPRVRINLVSSFTMLMKQDFARGAFEQYRLPYTILRPFNCVGIGERRASRDVEIMSGNVKLALVGRNQRAAHVKPGGLYRIDQRMAQRQVARNR